MTPPKKLIYVIDDDEVSRNQIAKMVLRAGFNCALFESGHKLLSTLSTSDQKPDLILLDLVLKDSESGLDVLTYLKSNEETAYISVIMITGTQQVDAIKKAFLVGISDFLLKPIKSDVLLQRIKENLTIKIDEENIYQLLERLHVENTELLNAVGLKEFSNNKRCYPVSYQDANLVVLIPTENRPKHFLNIPIVELRKKVKIFRNAKVRWNQIWPWLSTDPVLSSEESQEKEANRKGQEAAVGGDESREEMLLDNEPKKQSLLDKVKDMVSQDGPYQFTQFAQQLTHEDVSALNLDINFELRGEIIKNILKWSDDSTGAAQEAEIWKDRFPHLDPNHKNKKGGQR